MDVFLPLVIGLGAAAVGAILLYVSRRLSLALPSRRDQTGSSSQPTAGAPSDEAVLLVEASGRVRYANDLARSIFALPEGDLPNLRQLARRTRPAADFLKVCEGGTTAHLTIDGHLYEASVYTLQVTPASLVLVALRQADILPALGEPAAAPGPHTLRSIASLSQSISSSLDMPATLAAIFQAVQRLIPADQILVSIWDDTSRQLLPYTLAQGSSGEDVIQRSPELPQTGESLGAWMIASRQPVLASLGAGAALPAPSPLQAAGMQSILAAPMFDGKESAGVLELGSARPDSYRSEHLELLQLVASQAAVALRNAMLYQREQKRSRDLSSLAQLTQVIGSLDSLNGLYERLVRIITPMLGVSTIGFLTCMEGQTTLECINIYQGLPDDPHPVDFSAGTVHINALSSQVLLSQDVIISEDASADPHWETLGLGELARITGLHDAVLVPMVAGGRPCGFLLAADHTEAGLSFANSEIHLLLIIANQVAPILENARLVQQARQRAESAESLRRISALAASNASLDDILSGSLRELAGLSFSDSAAILLMDPSRSKLSLHRPSLLGPDIKMEDWAGEITASSPLFNTISAQTLQPVVIASIGTQDPAYQVYLPLLRSLEARSALVMPLVSRDAGLGELVLASRQANHYTRSNSQLVAAAAVQLGGVVERSRLFTETDDSLRRRVTQLTALTGITRELNTSLDPVYLLKLVYHEALRTTGAACGSILLLDVGDSGQVSRRAIQYSEGDPHSPDLSELEAHTVLSGATLTIDDFTQTPWLPGHLGVNSALLVPVSYQEKVAGLIHLHSPRLGGFDQTAVEITEALAVQAAAVLNNALQYQEQIRRGRILDRQAQTLACLSETVQELRRDPPLDEALAAVARGIRDAALFQVILISLYQPFDGTLRRVYAEGVPEDMWEELRSHTHPWRSVLQMFQPQFRINNSYFIPIEQEPLVPEDIHMVTVLPGSQRREADAWDPDDMLAVPLYSPDGSPLGLITVDAPLDGRRPDRQTIETVEIFAAQAAAAIENHRRTQTLTTRMNHALAENEHLHKDMEEQKSRRQLEASVQAESGRRMSAQAGSGLLETLLDGSLQLIPGAQAGFVATWDVRSLCLVLRAARGYLDYSALAQIRYPVGGTESGQSDLVQVFLRGQARRIPRADFQQSFHFSPEDRLVYKLALGDRLPRSTMFIPIRSGDVNLGVLALDNFDEENAFSELDETLATSLTQQTALAVEKERLAQAADLRGRQLQALTQVAGTLTFSVDSASLASSAIEQLAVLVPFDYAGLYMASGSEFALAYSRSPRPSLPELLTPPLKPDNPILAEAARSGQPILVSDTSQDARFSGGETQPAASWLGLPLFAKGELIGLVSLFKNDPDYYTSEHVQLASAFAGQAAIALENSRLFTETRSLTGELENRVHQRTIELQEQVSLNETLLSIMTELSASLDIGQVLARTLRLINQASDAEQSAVFLNQEGSLHAYTREGSSTEILPPGGLSALEAQICARVRSSAATLVVDDLSRSDLVKGNTPVLPWRSLAAVPLIHGEETLGVFLLLHSKPAAFAARRLELAQAAARQISVALKNSELFTVIRDQAENMGALLREQQIAASRSQAILEAVADGVVVTGDSGRISFFNASAERILSVKATQVDGQDVSTLTGLLGKPSEAWVSEIRACSALTTSSQPAETFQCRLTLENGQIAGVHLSPVFWRGVFLGTVSILRDITAEVMVDRMKSDFVANVSHELRTPMTSIKGYVEVLLMGAAGSLNEQQIQSLQVVRSNTERLSLLVNDLLDVSRIEAGRITLNLEALDLAQLCEDVVAEFRRRSRTEGKPIEIDLQVAEGTPHVQGDRQRLRQVFSNLVGNAWHYTPAGGHIQVRLKPQGAQVLAEVADDGIGILPQHQPRVFERFHRGDDPLVLASPGTGLGLSIVKSLVEMHNGRIWFASSGQRGEGTTFSLLLPAWKENT